jgi:hypothetical protein
MPRATNKYWELRGLDPNSEAYKAIVARYQEAEAETLAREAHRKRLVMGILGLIKPVRSVNVSKLLGLSESELVAIGKAARALHDELNKHLSGKL